MPRSRPSQDAHWFDSPESRDRMLTMYKAQLEGLPIPVTETDVETSFGNTHVVKAGDPANHPLVLVHGTNASAPAILEAFVDLADDYHVHAIDVIGQPNKSSARRLSMKNDQYGQWMNEVLEGLQVEKVRLVGVSFGGFLCMKAAAYTDERIKDIFLISAGGLGQGSMLKMFVNAFMPMQKFRKTGKEEHFQKFIRSSITDASNLTMQAMKEILLHYKVDTTPIPSLSRKEAARITKPVHILSSEKDMFFPASKVIPRAQAIFPSLAGTLLLENTLHVPSEKDTKRICEYMGEIP